MLIIKRNTTKNLVYLENNKIKISHHIVLGCDKTVTNTRRKNWVIKNIEIQIKRLQWCNYVYILEKLPFKYLPKYWDNVTTKLVLFLVKTKLT